MKTILYALLIVFWCAAAFYDNYTDKQNETITDNVTGLTWQNCSNGLSGASVESGKAAEYNWHEATGTRHSTYNCDDTSIVCGSLNLSGTGSRFPNINGLASIVDTSVESSTSGRALTDRHFQYIQGCKQCTMIPYDGQMPW